MEKRRFIISIVGVYLFSMVLLSETGFDRIRLDEEPCCPWCECHQPATKGQTEALL
jgi:hypothetical protein